MASLNEQQRIARLKRVLKRGPRLSREQRAKYAVHEARKCRVFFKGQSF